MPPNSSASARARPRWRWPWRRTIDQGGVLVVEAGTGVGKTFSYLVPALLSGERVLLSTATKTLQDQLFGRDLPRLVEALGLPVRTALLKGRASYLCLHRLELARHDASLPERGTRAHAGEDRAMVQGHPHRRPGRAAGPGRALAADPAGDLHARELPGRAMPAVQALPRQPGAARGAWRPTWWSSTTTCSSPTWRCANRAWPSCCRRVRVVVFDEAHQLNETGVQFLGVQLGSGQALDFARDLLAAGLQHARGLVDWQQLAAGVERGARELRLAVGKQWPGTKLRWTGASPEGVPSRAWQDALEALAAGFRARRPKALDTVSELSPDFVRLHERAAATGAIARRALPQACAPESVRWVDVGNQLRLVESPLDIAEAVRTRVLKHRCRTTRGAGARLGLHLGHAGRRSAACAGSPSPAGSTMPRCCACSSPVRLLHARRRCTCRAPFPSPTTRRTARRWRSSRRAAPRALGGRTLVLTTTLRALRTIGDDVRQPVRAAGCGARGRRCWCRASCPSGC